MDPLTQRVRGDELVELADDLGVPAGRERRVDRQLAGAQPLVVEAPDLGAREGLVGDVVERPPAPQRQRLVHERARPVIRAARLPHELLEPHSVDRIGGHAQLVASSARQDRSVAAIRLKSRSAGRLPRSTRMATSCGSR